MPPHSSASGRVRGSTWEETEISAPAGEAAAGSLPAGESKEEIPSLGPATDADIERELMKEANAVEMGGRKFSVMKKKLVDKAKKDPEMVSQLIRSLLRERA